MTVETQQAEVLRIRDLGPWVRKLTLVPLERPISFKPGQWVSLHLPVGQRPPLVRAYSMAEPQSPTGHLVLAFDRVPQGLGSGYLFTLKVGAHVVMAGPYGRFILPEPLGQDLLLMARFTGIVPIHCMLKHLFAQEQSNRQIPDNPTTSKIQATLVYSARRQEDLIYHEEFTALAAHIGSFRYVPILSGGDGHAQDGVQKEIEVIGSLFGGRRNFYPMIAGVKSFVHPLRRHFTGWGFGRKELRYEIYD